MDSAFQIFPLSPFVNRSVSLIQSKLNVGFWLLRLTISGVLLAIGFVQAAPPTLPNGQYWKLVFEDEFTGTTLDSSNWVSGFGDRENLGSSAPNKKNIGLSDGQLILSATQEAIGGKPNSVGCVNTKGKFEFKQGYVEFKMKAPKGNGFTTLISIISKSQILYMNMLENPARMPNSALAVLYLSPKAELRWTSPTPFATAFREYGLEWNANSVAWFIDGIERVRNTQNIARYTDVAYLSLQLFVGDGGYAGATDNTTPWPGTEEFEYVRIYQVTDQKPAGIGLQDNGRNRISPSLNSGLYHLRHGVIFRLPNKKPDLKKISTLKTGASGKLF